MSSDVFASHEAYLYLMRVVRHFHDEVVGTLGCEYGQRCRLELALRRAACDEKERDGVQCDDAERNGLILG